MSQGTPRKFSEKIAIMERREAEDAASFETIMAQVQQITSNPQGQQQQPCTSATGLLNPAAGAAWQRAGGSLPNVNEIAMHHPGAMMHQQMLPPGALMEQQMLACQPGMYAMSNGPSFTLGPSSSSPGEPPMEARVMHATRGRSPGAGHHPHQHFHPYRQPSPTQMYRPPSSERVPPFDPSAYPYPPSVIPGPPNLLQPPEQQWRKARSDPAIHTNVSNYRNASISSQGSAGSSPHSPNEFTPPQDVSPPAMPPLGLFQGDISSQVSPGYFDPLKGAHNQLRIDPNSCEPPSNYPGMMPSQQQQQQQDAISGSPGGSLPNLPSPLRGTTIGAKGPGFYPPPYAETMGPLPTAGGAAQHNPQQQVSVGGHMTVQQRHSIQLPPGGTGYQTNAPTPHTLTETLSECRQHLEAATPPYSAESQSAPTSPAEQSTTSVSSPGSTTYEIQSQLQNIQLQPDLGCMTPETAWFHQQNQTGISYPQQNMPQGAQRTYSTSPDVMSASPNSQSQIPNIILTGPAGDAGMQQRRQQQTGGGGDSGMDFFQDLQDVTLTFDPSEMRQLLSNADNQVDPATERALRLDN